MPRTLQRNVTLEGLLGACAVACVHPYEQPSVSSPHAVVKVRLAYHDQPGPQLSERVRLNDFDILMPPDETRRATPATEAVRVRPEPAVWSISSNFYHTYTTTTYQSSSYTCGTSTCTRMVPVTTTHTVTDGACSQSLAFMPKVGDMYVLQYDFLGADQCTLVCMRQVFTGNDQFTSEPCPIVAIVEQ